MICFLFPWVPLSSTLSSHTGIDCDGPKRTRTDPNGPGRIGVPGPWAIIMNITEHRIENRFHRRRLICSKGARPFKNHYNKIGRISFFILWTWVFKGLMASLGYSGHFCIIWLMWSGTPYTRNGRLFTTHILSFIGIRIKC